MQVPLEFEHVIGEAVGRVGVAPHRPHRGLVAARRTSEAEIDPPRVQRGERAELLGDPRPLASALAKLDRTSKQIPMDVDPAHATAYIVNPLTGRQADFTRLFMTHPPMEERIARLLGARSEVAA